MGINAPYWIVPLAVVVLEIAEYGTLRRASMRLPGRSGRFRRRIESIRHCLRLRHGTARLIFPNSQEQEGDCGGGDQELGPAGDFGFRLPAEELGGQKESKASPHEERGDRYQNVAVPRVSRPVDSILQLRDEVGGGKE